MKLVYNELITSHQLDMSTFYQ